LRAELGHALPLPLDLLRVQTRAQLLLLLLVQDALALVLDGLQLGLRAGYGSRAGSLYLSRHLALVLELTLTFLRLPLPLPALELFALLALAPLPFHALLKVYDLRQKNPTRANLLEESLASFVELGLSLVKVLASAIVERARRHLHVGVLRRDGDGARTTRLPIINRRPFRRAHLGHENVR